MMAHQPNDATESAPIHPPMMKHPILLLSAMLLCSCSTAITTSNPAQAYASTAAYREIDGSIHVVGDWDYVVRSTVTDPPMIAVGGFAARLVHGECLYGYALMDATFKAKASAFSRSPGDMTSGMKVFPYSRAILDQAAQGAGLTVPVPRYRTSQFFSAAYLRGFLQKVDETVRNPAAVTAAAPPDES
jgi:hypothetical protein